MRRFNKTEELENRILTKVIKITMIQSVLSNLLIHCMSLFKDAKRASNCVDRSSRESLWNQPGKEKTVHGVTRKWQNDILI